MDELNLSELRNNCLTSLYSCTKNISKYLDDTDEKDEKYGELRACIIEYCKMELQEDASKKAIQSCEEESDFADWPSLKNQFDVKLAQFNKKHGKFERHRYVKDLEKHIEQAKRSLQEQVLEQDLAITETTDCYIDPLTKKPISNPVRNTICKHVYEKDTIGSIINSKKNKGCPYMGCTNKQIMLAQHLELDEELLLTIRGPQQPSQAWE